MLKQRTLEPLVLPADVVFSYDGSFDGFLCCVYESVRSCRLPFAIVTEGAEQLTLMEERAVDTCPENAERVRRSLERISPRVPELVENVFLSCLQNRELAMLRFVLLACREGARAPDMLGSSAVDAMIKAERSLLGESHLLLGFVRFSDCGGLLAATITPKNFVLPLMARHFVERFSRENFLIYDKTHGAALLYRDGRARILPMEEAEFPPPSPQEEYYRTLWKRFYGVISIKERYNPKCRMTHIPKRYWQNMTEMAELL
jgi:probable DNA metabolism protein